MRSIGEMARASGLTVSALRFYDGAGLLVPAWVDPETGYRWYAETQLGPARLLARLRRVGMPLAEIALVLARRADPAAVRPLLDGHLRRLEDGLADARRELSHVYAQVLGADEENPEHTRLILNAEDLAAALDAVRFAVGVDPELPVLTGVLFEVENAALRLVATDRYRLAVAEARARDVAGQPISALVPASTVDEIRVLVREGGEVEVTLDAAAITVTAAGREVRGERLDHDFPDYRRLVRIEGAHRITVDVASLRVSLDGGPEVVVLTVDREGALTVGPGPEESAMLRIGVNREFLLEALAAVAKGQLVLELDGPITPLAIRLPDDDRAYSLLMPTKLTA